MMKKKLRCEAGELIIKGSQNDRPDTKMSDSDEFGGYNIKNTWSLDSTDADSQDPAYCLSDSLGIQDNVNKGL